MNEPLPAMLRRVIARRAAGGEAYACLLIRARGSTPQSAGALMIVDDGANTFGTIGGGCVEAEIRRRAVQLMSERRSRVVQFTLDHDYGWDDGLICGGTIDVAIGALPDSETVEGVIAALASRVTTALSITAETDTGPVCFTLHVEPPQRLYIAGAGHVGQALARLARTLEFDVTVFDDRADLLERSVDSSILAVAGDIAQNLGAAPVDGETYCVIVTRGHRHDEQALHAVVERGAAYVGMIGSRRKVKLIRDDLIERGVDAAALDAVHAPVGIDIGAVTVDEIALSIAAQLVEVRRRHRKPLIERTSIKPTTAAHG